MSTEENKRVVQIFMDLFERSAMTDLLDTMTDDATWEIVGKPELFAGAGVKTKAEMARIWPDLDGKLDGELEMSVTGMIADGDLVAAEVRSHAVTKAGKVYENEYHFLITVRDGRIAAVKEYKSRQSKRPSRQVANSLPTAVFSWAAGRVALNDRATSKFPSSRAEKPNCQRSQP